MNLSNFSYILIIILSLTRCAPPPSQTDSPDLRQTQLLEAINTFNHAFQTGDMQTIESLITTNYIHTNGNAKSIRRSDWLPYIRKRSQQIKEGRLTVTAYEMQETDIEMLPQSAIVTAKIIVRSTEDGNPKEQAYRITNIWVEDHGIWKRAGFHDGKIK
ncbi:MAG: nuclear transport factor 2 family protein [Bacteroidota bacterium]